MSEKTATQFEEWAVLELFGHQRLAVVREAKKALRPAPVEEEREEQYR